MDPSSHLGDERSDDTLDALHAEVRSIGRHGIGASLVGVDRHVDGPEAMRVAATEALDVFREVGGLRSSDPGRHAAVAHLASGVVCAEEEADDLGLAQLALQRCRLPVRIPQP